jgi:release factor glutamine methyltransferase
MSAANCSLIRPETAILTLLQDAARTLDQAGIASPRLEAELLLCKILGCRRIDLYLRPMEYPSAEDLSRFRAWLCRRAAREPLQYITGEVEFCGILLHVSPGVFIPRPETEWLVEAAKQIVPAPQRILDLCTGSGALAIALARQFPNATVYATDLSPVALAVAQQNAERQQSRVLFREGDLFSPFESTLFDLIVCNPPYIPEAERPHLQPEVRDYEPACALYAAEEGTAFYRRLLREAPSYLAPSGSLILEMGDHQSEWLGKQVQAEGRFSVTFLPDLSGVDRIAILNLL